MMFDASGNLYAANPNFTSTAGGAGVETFASNGTGPAAFGGPASVSAGSVRIDSGPNPAVYLGLEANSLTGNLLKYNPGVTTAPSATYYPAYYSTSGVFAFEIAHDNATMYYTIGGTSIYSYNFVLGLQNPDLTDTLPGPYAGDLRQLPDGTLLLADGDRVVRVSTVTGAVTQTYQPTTFSLLLGLTLDPDGTDFWTDDSVSGIVYKINISSGSIVSSFNTNLAANQFFGLIGLGDIAVYGSPASGGNDLTVDLGGLGTGTVTSSPAGISCPPTCTANFGAGSVVTLTATPGAGSSFGGWTSNTACSGTSTCTITMSAAEAVTATFNTQQFTLTLTDAGTGSGTVTSSPAGINCTGTGPNCSANFNSGTQVTLTETPASGSTFAGWAGACSGTGSCVVTMSAAQSVTATFNTTTFPLTVTEAGTGSGTVTSSPAGVNCPTTCSANFNSGTQVTLTEAPASGSTFAGWSGACSGTGSCVVTMSAAESVTATFNTTTTFALTVTEAGTGSGSVSSAPSGILCPSTCTANFASGTQVTLTAIANSGSTFAGWSGNAACSGTGTCTITMSAAESVTATFNTQQFALTVTKAGTGTGTVTSSPAGINCGSTCSANFNSGSQVTLTAIPNSGSTFAGWSGNAACSGTGTCTITMSAAEGVTATFNTGAPLTINVDILNNGTSGVGTVTDSTGAINCTTTSGQGQTGTCSTTYPVNSTVTFTETPGAGSGFTGWSNYPCQSGGNPNQCTISVTTTGSLFASFANGPGVFTLTVALPSNLTNSTGGGIVTSGVTGGGISCTFNGTNPPTGACSNSAEKSGAVLELIPVASANSTFGGYAGTCPSQVGNNCYVTMSQNQTVTPVFTIQQVTLNVAIPTGNGSLLETDTGNSGKINCTNTNGTVTGTCSASYPAGTVVTLTETPATGYSFTSFTGCATSTATTCTLTLVAGNTASVSGGFTINTYLLDASTEGGSGTGTVTSNANNLGGTINCGPNNQPPSGCGLFEQYNWPVTLTAAPSTGSTFAGWSASGVAGFTLPCTTSTTCTFNMPVVPSGALTVTATFNTTTTFPLTVTEAGTGGGTVSSSPSGILCPSTCSANFTSGAQVTLTATSNSGSAFAGWSGNAACSGTGSCTITMSATESVTATFNTATTFPLTVTEAGTGGGTVSSSPSGILCPSTCSGNFTSGTQVTLTATANSGSAFAGWSGNAACTGTGTCTLTMSAAQSVTATFNTQQFSLTLSEQGAGSGTVTSSPAGINCPTTCSANFNSGTVVTLTETPASGSVFTGWGGACTNSTSTCTVTMNVAQSVTATFNLLPTFTLTYTAAGTGTGTVTSSPAGINCTTNCSANFPSGTVVTLTETPSSGSTFAGWAGACSGTGACSITMNSAQSVSATFNTTTTFALSVTEAGTGSGTVSSSPSGILCPSTCSGNFTSGTQVTLTATANSGSTFAGWSGNAACTGTGTCTLTMSAAQSVTATFNKTTFTLTVIPAGTGSGTITSQPGLSPAINCTTGSTTGCTASYPSGTTVTLTEAPASGSTFASWSLDCGGSTCTFSMTQNQNVTVTFTASGFPLTVTEAGTGTGSVVSAPSGISCPSTCSANFNSGTQVTLTATPGSGSTFAGWSGACSGTGTCTVTMNSAQSVTATFNKNQFQLTVTLAGTGTGSVSSSPSGITCPDGCSANFNAGSQVTLTETPGSGSNFAGWSGGGCTGTGTTCTVTMSAAESVTATFNNGANFTFTPSVGTSTSVNTTPGGNIVVGLVLSGTVKETVTLGCTSSAPQYLSCLITPTTVNLTGNGTTQVAIVLTSYCQGSVPGGAPGDGPQTPLAPLGMLLAIGLTLLLIGLVWSEGNRRRWALAMACLLAMAVTGAACNNLPQGPNGVTPPGNYLLTVTATVAGQPAQAIQINVNVK
ncbi:MAG TPA: hypothetical protein VJR23_06660 [Candidatus Acidoferrales bacterium]|nr:hypothetical protein [Candidatus Acidoferrales bacterium]